VTAILGVNFFSHDTAACLLVDGRPVLLVEQERLNRDMHTKQYPDGAIDLCLAAAGATIADVDAVAVAQRPAADLARGSADAIARRAPKRLAAQTFIDARLMTRVLHLRRRWKFRGPVRHIGHHDAHAAGCFFASPFEQAGVLTIDRGGDFLSTTLGEGQASHIRPLAQIRNPHSLGELYTAVTSHLGFRAGSDEGKVMGLAPYGSADLVPAMRETVRFLPDGLFEIDLRWFGYYREGAPVSPLFVDRFGPPRVPESELDQRHKDVAYAVQEVLEEAAVHVGRGLRDRVTTPNLCLSGGVALNSVMNRRLLMDCGFEDIFIQPAASDAGNALGAALWVWHVIMGRPRDWSMTHAYFGREWADHEIKAAFADRNVEYRTAHDPAALAARLVSESKVVGWFQGRAEIGPRALGARSILADPRRADMRDIVNHQVKRREWFRPFAPSVLEEHAADYFEGYHANPFMLIVQPVKPNRRDEIPAVTHVDGTARLQTVSKSANPEYHRLISEFRRLTGVPVVLNTSFNLRGEPMVHRPEEAIDDYLRSGMDAVIIGDHVAEKAPAPSA
jgi:carbamoyltransferase